MTSEKSKVISAAEALSGDIAKAVHWYYDEPIADYGLKTAAELVTEGQFEAVMAHLREMEIGANG